MLKLALKHFIQTQKICALLSPSKQGVTLQSSKMHMNSEESKCQMSAGIQISALPTEVGLKTIKMLSAHHHHAFGRCCAMRNT